MWKEAADSVVNVINEYDMALISAIKVSARGWGYLYETLAVLYPFSALPVVWTTRVPLLLVRCIYARNTQELCW